MENQGGYFEKGTKRKGSYEGGIDPDCCNDHHSNKCLFFSGAESCIDKQYFRSGDCAFQLCPAAVVGDHHDLERRSSGHRFFYLRKRVWSEDGLYQHLYMQKDFSL